MFTRSHALCLLALATFWFVPLSSALSADSKSQASKPKSQLKFEVYQDSANEYRWRLVSGEGNDRQVLATGGQGYKAKADCMHGVKAVQEGADKLTFETYDDNAKQSRWRAKASNGQVMAACASSYKTKADCDAAVKAIKDGVAKATVEEIKEPKS